MISNELFDRVISKKDLFNNVAREKELIENNIMYMINTKLYEAVFKGEESVKFFINIDFISGDGVNKFCSTLANIGYESIVNEKLDNVGNCSRIIGYEFELKITPIPCSNITKMSI